MAKFITNSTNDAAIRKEEVVSLVITSNTSGEPPASKYELRVNTFKGGFHSTNFETDSTLGGIQAKAATLLAALEE